MIFYVSRNPMRPVATAVLLSLMMVFVCRVDGALTSTNACCQSCSMAEGTSDCDCCRLASPELPTLVTPKAFDFSPQIVVAALRVEEILILSVPINPSFVRSTKFIRDHSPPKLYVLHASFLI